MLLTPVWARDHDVWKCGAMDPLSFIGRLTAESGGERGESVGRAWGGAGRGVVMCVCVRGERSRREEGVRGREGGGKGRVGEKAYEREGYDEEERVSVCHFLSLSFFLSPYLSLYLRSPYNVSFTPHPCNVILRHKLFKKHLYSVLFTRTIAAGKLVN